jgi:hypothetical protein
VARQVWRAFCRHGARFIACWCALPTEAERRWDRGTMFISGRDVFPVDEFGKSPLVQLRGTKPLSGRELVKVQKCGKRHGRAIRVYGLD